MPDRGPSLLISFHASAPSPLPYLSQLSMPRCSPAPVIKGTARRRGEGDGGGLEGRGWGVSGHTLYLGWIERRYSRCWRFAASCKQTHTWHATYTNTSTAEVRAFHLSPTNATRPQAPPSFRQQLSPPPPPPSLTHHNNHPALRRRVTHHDTQPLGSFSCGKSMGGSHMCTVRRALRTTKPCAQSRLAKARRGLAARIGARAGACVCKR